MLRPAVIEIAPCASSSEKVLLPIRAPAAVPELSTTSPSALIVMLFGRAGEDSVLPMLAPLNCALPPVISRFPPMFIVRSVALSVFPPRPPIRVPLNWPIEAPPVMVRSPVVLMTCLGAEMATLLLTPPLPDTRAMFRAWMVWVLESPLAMIPTPLSLPLAPPCRVMSGLPLIV